MVDVDVVEDSVVQERVTLHEPADGWSREGYDRALGAYVAEHGRTPQTVTMHPDTAAVLDLGETWGEPAAPDDAPFLVTSRDYDRQTIVWYY